jgi:hypothetical protein
MTPHPTASSPLAEEGAALLSDMQAQAHEYREQSQARYESALRGLGNGEEADQAIADGALVLNDCTVVMRRNASNDFIEFFCDIGLPPNHDREAAYRVALEMNLCRTYPGITLGVHPDSGRLVATISVHGLMLPDEDAYLQALELLTLQVLEMRDSQLLPLAPAEETAA